MICCREVLAGGVEKQARTEGPAAGLDSGKDMKPPPPPLSIVDDISPLSPLSQQEIPRAIVSFAHNPFMLSRRDSSSADDSGVPTPKGAAVVALVLYLIPTVWIWIGGFLLRILKGSAATAKADLGEPQPTSAWAARSTCSRSRSAARASRLDT